MVSEENRVSKAFIENVIGVIENLHINIIIQSGGEQGVRDEGGLYNSVYKILRYQNIHNKDPISVGSFVYKELSRRHHFNDGNKRTAHIFSKIILFTLGFHFKIEYKDAIDFIIRIAEHNSKISFGMIKECLSPHLIQIPERDIAKYINEIILEVTNESKK